MPRPRVRASVCLLLLVAAPVAAQGSDRVPCAWTVASCCGWAPRPASVVEVLRKGNIPLPDPDTRLLVTPRGSLDLRVGSDPSP